MLSLRPGHRLGGQEAAVELGLLESELCVYVYIHMCTKMCMCVYLYMFIYIYILYVFMCFYEYRQLLLLYASIKSFSYLLYRGCCRSVLAGFRLWEFEVWVRALDFVS